MKKKILFLEQQSWLSGAQRVLESVLEATAEEYDPIVAFPDEGPFQRALADRKIQTLTYPLGSYQTGQKSRAEMLDFAGRSLLCSFKLATLIRREEVGLVYINGPRCMPAGVLAAQLTRRPALFHLHLTLVRKPEILLVAGLGRYVSTIVSCSRAAAAGIVSANRCLATKTHILYNPVAGRADATKVLATPQPPAGNSSVLTIGVVGRITKPKGQRILLNAVGRLSAKNKAMVRVIFVGAPSPGNGEDLAYDQRLKECAAQFCLETKTSWAGYQAVVGPFYRAMDVLVQPSLVDSGESMPLAVLEALQHGVPVIASWTGGIPEVIRHGSNGLLVPPGDEVALARTLERFIQDASLRARLCAGAQSGFDERFSLEAFKSRIRGLIWKLCTAQHMGNTKTIHEESVA
ncbi:MAG: glycosyltransferase family 1 protein [Acidobacteria bacterium]|nr:MAG: glycosyltransferase family 1 protein [Acidobacteriota bacterium]